MGWWYCSGDGDGDTTTWLHDTTYGRLVEKNYQGENDDPRAVPPVGAADYTYTPAGRLYTRVWEREVTTTYGYTHGELTAVSYSGEPGGHTTPDLVYTRDRLGRIDTVTQTNQSQLAYTYAADLGIDTETICYDLNQDGTYGNSGDFTRVLDRAERSLGRDTGWDLKRITVPNPLTYATEHSASYTYHAATGRLSTVGNTAMGTFTYAYRANSNLVESVTKAASGNDPSLSATRIYGTTRDVLDTIENKAGQTTVSKYVYSVNAIGQRTELATDGTAFGTTKPSWKWRYDAIGQLEKAGTDVTGNGRAFAYDAIGNRITAAEGDWAEVDGDLTTFNPTDPDASHTTSYFATDGTPPADPGATPLNQYAAIVRGTAKIAPHYDADGNMDKGPLPPNNPDENSTLRWDAENRLVEVLDGTGSTSIVKYTYDALSRRIATVIDPDDTSVTTLSVYDGWNPIAEYTIQDSEFKIQKSYLWGLDLSGSLQGAGGVGGMLALRIHTGAGAGFYYPCYDGNGNISEYLTADGGVSAHFEYDPFGNTLARSTGNTEWFDYRFSTKPLDSLTGLYYYGYRWYDPLTGRWPSRDPIGEDGGMNLYGFVGNDGVNRVDVLGYFLFGSSRVAKPVLSYSTVEKKLGICGGALWKIRWHVSGATWTRGSIYQQITTKGWAQPCGHATGNKVSLDYPDFTEYWRVESAIKNNQPISTITDSAGGIDLFLAPAKPTCTKGKLTITANAMYADGVFPNAPSAPSNVGQAGKLWAEWGHVYPRNAVAYSAYVKRKWTIKWDCCDGLPLQSEVSYSE